MGTVRLVHAVWCICRCAIKIFPDSFQPALPSLWNSGTAKIQEKTYPVCLSLWMGAGQAVQEILCNMSSAATLALLNTPWKLVCREGGGWTWVANPWAHTLGWYCLCLLGVQLQQYLTILLMEPAAHSAALTDLRRLRISPGAGPDFSAHYGTELLTDDLNSLACGKFVHTLSGAAGRRSWPHILAEKLRVLFLRIKIPESSV